MAFSIRAVTFAAANLLLLVMLVVLLAGTGISPLIIGSLLALLGLAAGYIAGYRDTALLALFVVGIFVGVGFKAAFVGTTLGAFILVALLVDYVTAYIVEMVFG